MKLSYNFSPKSNDQTELFKQFYLFFYFKHLQYAFHE